LAQYSINTEEFLTRKNEKANAQGNIQH
jgi:hypothetical protein